MGRTIHVIGNGDMAPLYHLKKREGMKVTCNLPPFPVPDAWCTFMVDFKIMHAITQQQLDVPGEWIIGMRPKIWMDKNPTFYIQRAHQVKEIYTELPKYAANYTDFNCGHMAVYYCLRKLNASDIHLYGFDSVFDFNLRSCSDLYLSSARDPVHSNKLKDNWRPLWYEMFKEYKDVNFTFYHNHSNIKMKPLPNVKIEVGDHKKVKMD